MLRSQRSYRSSWMERRHASTEVHRGISTAARGGPTPAHAGRSPPHSAAAIVHKHFHSGSCISLYLSLLERTRFTGSIPSIHEIARSLDKELSARRAVSPSLRNQSSKLYTSSARLSLSVWRTLAIDETKMKMKATILREDHPSSARRQSKILKAESTKRRWKRELAGNDWSIRGCD